MRVFGSVVRGETTEGSDVDLLIDVPAGTGLVAVRQMSDAVAAVLPWPRRCGHRWSSAATYGSCAR